MSFMDKAKAKLTDAVDQHGDKIAQGIDKAGSVVNEKTGGKHADKIRRPGKARDALDSLDGKNDDLHVTPAAARGVQRGLRPRRESRRRATQSEAPGSSAGAQPEAAKQQENAETSLDQPSTWPVSPPDERGLSETSPRGSLRGSSMTRRPVAADDVLLIAFCLVSGLGQIGGGVQLEQCPTHGPAEEG